MINGEIIDGAAAVYYLLWWCRMYIVLLLHDKVMYCTCEIVGYIHLYHYNVKMVHHLPYSLLQLQFAMPVESYLMYGC